MQHHAKHERLRQKAGLRHKRENSFLPARAALMYLISWICNRRGIKRTLAARSTEDYGFHGPKSAQPDAVTLVGSVVGNDTTKAKVSRTFSDLSPRGVSYSIIPTAARAFVKIGSNANRDDGSNEEPQFPCVKSR